MIDESMTSDQLKVFLLNLIEYIRKAESLDEVIAHLEELVKAL